LIANIATISKSSLLAQIVVEISLIQTFIK